MGIQSAIQEFEKMDVVQQKEKLLYMLEQIKNSDQVFLDIFTLLSKDQTNIDQKFLIGIYGDILVFAEAIATYNSSNKEKSLMALQKKLQAMHEEEMKDRDQEQKDIEVLLQKI